jgi:hypothetical protein
VLRRVAPPESERMYAGEVEIDRPTRRVTVAEQRVLLPTKEYELLLKLASDPRRVFTKDELLRDVWGFRSTGGKRRIYPFGRSRLTSAASRQPARGRPPCCARSGPSKLGDQTWA